MKRPERIPLGTGHFVDEYDVDEIFDKSLVAPTIAATMLPFTGMAIDKQRNNSLGPRKQKRASRDSADTKDAVSANAGGNSFGGSSLFGGGEKATVELARVDETSSSSTAAVRRLLIAPPSPFGGGGGMPIFSQQQHEEHHRFPKAAGKRKESISESKQRKASKTMANSSALANLFQAGTNIFGTLNPNLAYEQRVGREVSAAVESIAYVAEHMKAEMSDKKVFCWSKCQKIDKMIKIRCAMTGVIFQWLLIEFCC
jgi:hypothetical protein